MHAALRPYATAGIAVVGASVIAVTPFAAPQPAIRSADLAVRLTAASIANVPANLINAVLNLPMAEVQGMQRFADAMAASGSWWVYTPVNVLGWDPANPEMTKGLFDMLLPFKPLSTPVGTHVNWWLAANLPMHPGCSGLPPCTDPIGMLSSMFTVGPWEFYDADGYTFPKIINPISEHEGEVGQELGETGEEVEWSEQQVILDPFEPFTSVANYLMADPGEVTFPTLEQAMTTVDNLVRALRTTFYPFVPMSYIWNPQYQLLAPLFRLFAPVLCPDCNPADPSLPPVTSVASPDSARMVTLDAPALRAPDGDARQNVNLSNQVASPGAQQNSLPDTAATTESRSSDVGVLTTAPTRLAPEAGQRPDNASPPLLETLKPTTSTSTNETSDGNMVKPGQVGTTPRGRLDGALRSIGDRIDSRISDFTNRLAGRDAQTDSTSTDSTSTDGTGE